MRRLEDLNDAVRKECLDYYTDDERSAAAFDYAVAWLRTHFPHPTHDRATVTAHCRRAVECRGRNEQVCGGDWFGWDEIVSFVIGRLVDWLFGLDRGVVYE